MDRLNDIVNRNLTVQNIEKFKELCPVTALTHGGMGFGVGLVFGIFMSSFATGPELNSMQNISQLPLRQQASHVFKDMGKKSWATGKSFGYIGMLYSGTECCIESYRAKRDWYIVIASGCVTGAILGAKSGPQSAFLGCAGFSAFSTAIEYFIQDS